MKALFVTYCFGLGDGQTLIGVYKRGLRVALEMCEQGHEVAFYCSGRENFHDAMTAEAERRMQMIDWPFEDDTPEQAEANRLSFLRELEHLAPDVVVIGEAPLAGSLLELTLCAAELGIPAVCLDNIYEPGLTRLFCDHNGAAFDGLVLAGPSSFHLQDPPDYLLQVPPYIDADPDEAGRLLQELGLSGERLLTVLAYDHNVEALGASILSKLGDPSLEALFITHRTEDCRERLDRLPLELQENLRVIRPQSDRRHFGLLQQSRLVVGKCAYMQVTECLSLRTPILGFYFHGDFQLDYIPEVCKPFTWSSSDASGDEATVEAARRLLQVQPEELDAVHSGGLGAARKAVQRIAELGSAPCRSTMQEVLDLGLSEASVHNSLQQLYPGKDLQIDELRAIELRRLPTQKIFSVVCRFRADGTAVSERLWWRRFLDKEEVQAEAARATAADSGRRLYFDNGEALELLERDVGQPRIPTIEEAEAAMRALAS